MPPVPAVPMDDDDSGVEANVKDVVAKINSDVAVAVVAADGDDDAKALPTATEVVTNGPP
jgi:hypothetical protein